MNAHNRRHFTTLLPCQCGQEPIRAYYPRLDLFAVKCDCGNRTKGFTTIAGAGHSWNVMNKKQPPPACKTEDGRYQTKAIVRPEKEIVNENHENYYQEPVWH